jgi:HlyD family secretion protein
MIEARALALTLTIIFVDTIGGSPAAAASDSPRFSIAQTQSELQSKLHTLIDKLRGVDMPAGIVKTNGRIEATQVDIAAKYPGRLESAAAWRTSTGAQGEAGPR